MYIDSKPSSSKRTLFSFFYGFFGKICSARLLSNNINDSLFLQEFLLFKNEVDEKSLIYNKLQNLVDTPSMVSITRESWKHLQRLWKAMELLVSFEKLFYIYSAKLTLINFFNADVKMAVVTRFSTSQ